MPPPESHCPTCSSPVCDFDQYCGVCGTVLARLRWRTPEEELWHSGDGHIAVHTGAASARVCFRNEGVVPAALVLCAKDIASLPPWVDRAALAEQVLVLRPGGRDTELAIPLVPALLAPLFAAQEGNDGEASREAYLPFLTNLNELRDGRWTSRPFKLTLIGARRPWVSPRCSFYPFLPLERLAGEGIVHAIELHNETVQPLELSEILISDDPEPAPPGYVRLAAAAIVREHSSPEGVRIEAGAIWHDTLPLALPDLPETALGWFSVLVEYLGESVDGRERHRISCLIRGRVGRGPRVAVQGSASLTIPSDKLDREHSFTLYNPGQVPVLVEAVEVLREKDGGEETAPERDWLSLAGLASGDVLGPQEVRTLSVLLNPALRQGDDFDRDECERRIRVRHDGLPRQGAGPIELEIFATFGKAQPFTAGIDFGTTNSVVCIGNMPAFALRLEPGLEQNRNRIRSLIYFDSNKPGRTDERFLFGEAAFASAGTRPENLVRSIKTVVARQPGTRYVFFQRTAGLGDQRVTKTPQELLNLFISELRLRAEQGARDLPDVAYDQLELSFGTQIRLSRAVFSHPAAMTDEARRALMAAAHGAGINESLTDLDEFFEQSCIDEATAAVLAYVAGRVNSQLILEAPPTDRERVLCFDMGGGTTDLAAVEVLQMASFQADDSFATRVIVNLANKAGARFGGDDLDELLTFMVLAEVRRQSEERKAPVLVEEVERAVRYGSFSEFNTDFQRRRAAGLKAAGTGGAQAAGVEASGDDEALGIYRRATEVLNLAEETKRKLSSTPESGPIMLPGTGWPRQMTNGHAAGMNFEVPVQGAVFEERVRARIQTHLPLLDSVVSGAGWDWPSVTTLLFTGQSARVPVIRDEVALHVVARRGSDAPPLLRIDPEQTDFDPKNCVAIGAAIWGADPSWLEIRNSFRERLTFDLETRFGPRFRPVRGLEKGKTLPAEGVVELQKGVEMLTLHRDQGKDFHVRFHFPPLRQAGAVTVRVKGPSDFAVVVDGREYLGEMRS